MSSGQKTSLCWTFGEMSSDETSHTVIPIESQDPREHKKIRDDFDRNFEFVGIALRPVNERSASDTKHLMPSGVWGTFYRSALDFDTNNEEVKRCLETYKNLGPDEPMIIMDGHIMPSNPYKRLSVSTINQHHLVPYDSLPKK